MCIRDRVRVVGGPVRGRQSLVRGEPLGHIAHHPLCLQGRASGSGAGTGQVVRGRKRSAVRQRRQRGDHTRLAAGTAPGDTGQATGRTAKLRGDRRLTHAADRLDHRFLVVDAEGAGAGGVTVATGWVVGGTTTGWSAVCTDDQIRSYQAWFAGSLLPWIEPTSPLTTLPSVPMTR